MKGKENNYSYSEERADFWVGLVTTVIVLGLIVWMIAGGIVRSRGLAPIEISGAARRGCEQVFTCQAKTSAIKDGATVKWYVNNELVSEDVYVKGEPMTLNYAIDKTGDSVVCVKTGRYAQYETVTVLPPLLTVSAPDVTITYGDELPELEYDCCGFVAGDDASMMQYDGKCVVQTQADLNRLGAGVYALDMEQTCNFKDYEVEYVGGTLTVLPKRLTADGFVKTYDGTNAIDNPAITLDGLVEGDDVTAACDKLYFDSKNAGQNKKITLANVSLCGEDCCNYTLAEYAVGAILPKQVAIDGLCVSDKYYDGTTRASVDKTGALDGICSGDSVAIGKINVSFESAEVGRQKVILDGVTLVGADKDNYVLGEVNAGDANINSTFWGKLFDKDPVVAG